MYLAEQTFVRGSLQLTRRICVAFAMPEDLLESLFTPEALDRLRQVADVRPGVVPRDVLTECAPGDLVDVDVLVTGWGSPSLTDEVLARMPRLGAVAHAAGSVKHHLPPEFWERGIRVTSAADVNALPVAEYTVAAVLFANKAVLPMAAAYREDPAGLDVLEEFPRIGNYAKRVGIVGASRIGRRVIELLAPFDLEVVVSDPYLDEADARELGVTVLSLDDLVATSDVVSIHAPDLPSTRHMIDARRLGLMRDGATLVNTARGALIDQDALVTEVVSGRLSAILDVTTPERLPADSPLLRLPNVLVTPHIAGSLGTELARLGDSAVDEVRRFAAGEPPLHVVLPEHLDRTA